MVDPGLIGRIDTFDELAAPAREALARGSVRRTFAPGEPLWEAGAPARCMALVLRGRVRVVSSVDGRRHVVHSGGPGSTLGEIPFLDGGPYPARAEAATTTECLLVTREGLEAALRTDPAVARALLRTLGGRVRELVDRLERATSHPVESRLARWLLDREAGSGRDFTLGETQASLAEELGTVREVVVRSLGDLVDRGVLARAGRGRYRVVDRAALERATEP
ncbi:MAG TPA: Crp/Fnr family transcriptional regulator [Longimicrobiales bacterium]|nr:Crp/Fnr family transcriptional regulator [Longimicrobiales bacterium]